jgi:S-adenosylmethionine decarboxylase
LNDERFVRQTLRRAVRESGATLISEVSHSFDPHGVTALGLLAESHISIHTWPEYAYAAVDVFTCGQRAVPEKACRYLVQAFRAGRHRLRRLARGPAADSEATHFVEARPQAELEESSGDEEGCPCLEPNLGPISG